MGRAGRKEKLQPQEKWFFLDSLYGTYQELAENCGRFWFVSSAKLAKALDCNPKS
jgi:hypothetical protein